MSVGKQDIFTRQVPALNQCLGAARPVYRPVYWSVYEPGYWPVRPVKRA
jgi:hypothetical protein